MKVLLKRFYLNVQASVCDFIVKGNETTLYKSINTVNIHVLYNDSHSTYCYYNFEKQNLKKNKQKKYFYQGRMIRRCSEKKKETIKINSFIQSCHWAMQKSLLITKL